MSLAFPSREFDDAVAAVCHGLATETEMRALNEVLRNDSRARDEYLMRVEMHARLASEPDLFAQPQGAGVDSARSECSHGDGGFGFSPSVGAPARRGRVVQSLALAAGLMVIGAGAWGLWVKWAGMRHGTTSTAVAMLAGAVDAHWDQSTASLRVGSALEPGWLRLKSGLAQVVFYSGARVVMEGPAELKLVSPMMAVCPQGKLLAEVPDLAHGFRVKTAQLNVVDLGTAFGIDATNGRTEVHVFKGEVEFAAGRTPAQPLAAGRAAMVPDSGPPRFMAANTAEFAALFELQQRSLTSEAMRYAEWRVASERLNQDPSLVMHLDFENLTDSEWTLRNKAEPSRAVPDATIIGCQRVEGRWPQKQALEFQSVNDRVRLVVPGDFSSLTLAAWVRINGLDRQFNSLFMCDGFKPGAIHWLIRNDGVLSLAVLGPGPGSFQILASPPVLTLDQLGTWLQLAVVVDGQTRQVVHYVNGCPVARLRLRMGPPYRLGPAELGNWDAQAGPNPRPFLIRNLSGVLGEFELFSRALGDAEVRSLYAEGKPESGR